MKKISSRRGRDARGVSVPPFDPFEDDSDSLRGEGFVRDVGPPWLMRL